MEKSICHACRSGNTGKPCKECERRLRNRHLIIVLAIFLIFILLYPIITNIGLYQNVKREVVYDVPVQTIKQVTVLEPVEKESCSVRPFRYGTMGGDVESLGDFVRPNLILSNLDERGGMFRINFSYIDEKRFPYLIYGGSNLRVNFESGALRYEDADFFSDNYYFYLDPGESILVKNLTRMKNNGTTYWAIADIVEPTYLHCQKVSEYANITKNMTFTEYKKEKKTIDIKEYRKISELTGINGFWQYLILVLLLLAIIILFYKIRYE